MLIFAVAIDLFSTVVTARRIRRGRGPSGIHGIASVFYLFAVVLTPLTPVVFRREPFWLFKILEVALILGFHLFQAVLLPDLFRRRWQPDGQAPGRTDS